MSYILDIKKGFVNTYIPLKFQYKDVQEYIEMIAELESSSYVISKQTFREDGVQLDLKSSFYDLCDRMNNTLINKILPGIEKTIHGMELEDKAIFTIDNENEIKYSPKISNNDSFLLEYINADIKIRMPSINISATNDIEEATKRQRHKIIDNVNFSSIHFGSRITKEKKLLMLWPILFKDNNDAYQVAPLDIEFFNHGLALLRISYPIENQPSSFLVENNINLYHESCFYPLFTQTQGLVEDFDYTEIGDEGIYKVIDIITSWLHSGKNNFLKTEATQIILLSKLKNDGFSFSKASKKNKEALYRIISAPFVNDNTLHQDSERVWEEKYWGEDIFRYYFSSMGKCVGLINKDMIKSLYKSKDKELDEYKINNSLLSDVESAYKILLLTKLNNINYLRSQEDENNNEVDKSEENFYLTHNYILGLLDESYGTVRDLYKKMTILCYNYLNQDSIEKRISNNERILKNRQSLKLSKMNDRITTLGLFIAIVVSFPAIYETLNIISGIFICIGISRQLISGIAVFIHISFLICLFYILFKKRKK